MSIETQRAGGGILPNHSNPGTKSRRMVSTTLLPFYPSEQMDIFCTGYLMVLGADLGDTKDLSPIRI